MEKSSLTFKAFRNATYNIIGFLWPMIFTLLVTPRIILGLGVKQYGIYIFVTSIITVMGILDLGLGTAVIKHLSYYYGKKDEVAIKRLVHSANSLFFIIGTIGLAISAAIAFGGMRLLPSTFAGYEQYSMLFLIGGGMFFLGTTITLWSSAITAIQRFDVGNKIGMLSVALSSLSMLATVKAGGSLMMIFIVQLGVMALMNCVIFWQAKKLFPALTFGFGWDAAEIRHCYSFGLVYFINTIASVSLSSLDRLIIPFFVGPSNLTYYSLPGNVTSKIPSMAGTLGASIFPTVSELSGSENEDRIRSLYVRSFRLIMIISAALTVTCVSFSYKVLAYWLNDEIASHSSNILILLALTNFLLALFSPLSSFLLGLGKVKLVTIASISMALLNVVLLIALLPPFGIMGAAWAYLLSVVPVIYFIYYAEKKFLKLPGRAKHYAKTISGVLATSLIVWIANFFLGRFANSLLALLIMGGVSALLFIIVYRVLGFFEPEDWKDLERFSHLILKKMNISLLSIDANY